MVPVNFALILMTAQEYRFLDLQVDFSCTESRTVRPYPEMDYKTFQWFSLSFNSLMPNGMILKLYIYNRVSWIYVVESKFRWQIFCEHSNEPFGSSKRGELHGKLT